MGVDSVYRVEVSQERVDGVEELAGGGTRVDGQSTCRMEVGIY